jgi:LysM repeat protein
LTLSLAPQSRHQTQQGPGPTPWSGPPDVDAPPAPPADAGPGPGTPAVRPRPATTRRPISVVVRRRRIVGGCLAVVLVLALAASFSGLAVLWVATVLVAGLAGAYAALVTWVVRRAGRRDLRDAFGAEGAVDWGQLEAELRLGEEGAGTPDQPPVAEATLTVAALARFAACSLAAWALTPLVMALRLAGGDLSDLERHDVVGRLVRFQQYGRSRSLQVLTASVAATATVAVVGSTASVAFAAPVVAAGAPSYTVQAGDTLGSIASSYGTTVAALAAANALANPNLIYPGQVLSLGAVAATAAGSSTSAPGSYTVRPGDTLGSIAASHGTTVAALAAANALADPNLIYVGQVLSLGGAAATLTSTTSPTSSGTTYTVQSGDTLAGIATREGTTWPALAALNDLSDPNVIFVGEVLSLVGSPTPTPAAAAPAATTPPAAAPSTTTVATPTATSSSAAEAVSVALAQVGKPYVYGGAGPNSFDCSGLVMYAWAAAGVSLPHYSVSQYSGTARITEAELEPGDIVFYDNESGPQPGHEALYIGNGQVVAANTTGTDVQTQSITYDGTPMGFGRVA